MRAVGQIYTETLLRETAKGIPNARLILYPGKCNTPAGKQFERDVLRFLREDLPEASHPPKGSRLRENN